MPYRIIMWTYIIIRYKIFDFIDEPQWEEIDYRTKTGKKRYFELFRKKKKQQRKRQRKNGKSWFQHPLVYYFSVQDNEITKMMLEKEKTLGQSIFKGENNENEIISVNTPEEPISQKKLARDQQSKTRGRPFKRTKPAVVEAIKKIKSKFKSFGRKRVKNTLPEDLKVSEATVGRILKDHDLQNSAKHQAAKAQLDIWAPELAEDIDSLDWSKDYKNGLVLLFFLFQKYFKPIIKPFLSPEEVTCICLYSLGIIFNYPLYELLDAIPQKIRQLIDPQETVTIKKIQLALKRLGLRKSFIFFEKIASLNLKKYALDEKIVEKYSKKNHLDFHNENCKIGYVYCSRRNKGVLAESIEVLTDNSQPGIALPIYFLYTPHTLTQAEEKAARAMQQSQNLSSGSISPSQVEEEVKNNRESSQTSSSSFTASPGSERKPGKNHNPKQKRSSFVISIFELVDIFLEKKPIRADNNYAQKEVIKYLQAEDWPFIFHGRANLKIGRKLKEKMKQEKLTYAQDTVDAPEYGGKITVVGYQKNDRIFLYLTNETYYATAKATMQEYRGRWRQENTFKWIPQINNLSGHDSVLHEGQLLVAFYFLATLCSLFNISIPKLERLLTLLVSVRYENSVLTITFYGLPKHQWIKLENLSESLRTNGLATFRLVYA